MTQTLTNLPKSFLSHIFHKYLGHLITHVKPPLQIQFASLDTKVRHWTLDNNLPSSTTNTFPSASNQAPTSRPSDAIPIKHLQILSSAFYSRLVSYHTFQDALASETLSSVVEENRTAQVSDNGELCALLAQAASEAQDQMIVTTESPPSTRQRQRRHRSLSDRLCWNLISTLRRRPEPGSYPSPGHPQRRNPSKPTPSCSGPLSTSTSTKNAQMPQGHVHFLDGFVRESCTRAEQREYQRTLLRLFIARRVAGGSTRLLWFYGVVIWILVFAAVVWMIEKRGGERG